MYSLVIMTLFVGGNCKRCWDGEARVFESRWHTELFKEIPADGFKPSFLEPEAF